MRDRPATWWQQDQGSHMWAFCNFATYPLALSDAQEVVQTLGPGVNFTQRKEGTADTTHNLIELS